MRRLEWFGGILLCALLVATPWMYGTTLDWSINLMNFGSFLAAGILAACAIYAAFLTQDRQSVLPKNRLESFWKVGFLVLNSLVLGYCATALLNARATF